jgi:TolA-binding protein
LQYYQELIKTYPESSEAAEAMANIKAIYVEEAKPSEYVDLMRNSGKDISDNEADSLAYVSAEMKYNANDCDASITGFGNYLSNFPNGAKALEANYYISECYDKKKDWANALKGYDYVFTKGVGRFYERSVSEAARISYFELKDYESAKKYFEAIVKNSSSPENQLDALRGLVRCYNLLKDYAGATEAAQDLLSKKGLTADDKAIALLVLGKSHQANNNIADAITAYKSLAAINKGVWGAEARYEIAHCQFTSNSLALAEKSALAVIKETGSFDLWVTKSYILLGDIFMEQKDYFNARSTYESVAKNAVIPELKQEAQQKLATAQALEKETSKNN